MNSQLKDATITEMYERFISRKNAINLSKESLKYYENCFKYFVNYFGRNGITCTITKDVYFDYMRHLRETRPDISPVTVNSYLRGIRAILYFGMQEGFIHQFKVPLAKQEKRIKETYSDLELVNLLEKPNIKTCVFTEYRNWVVINYLLATGNRLSSMINVRIQDIDFENSIIYICKTKNRQQQVIPLSVTLAMVLKEYLEYRGGKPEDFLFCDTCGNSISKYSMQSAIQGYNRKRGVTKTSIHVFRHTFAKKWILNGGDIFRLQKILGHESGFYLSN